MRQEHWYFFDPGVVITSTEARFGDASYPLAQISQFRLAGLFKHIALRLALSLFTSLACLWAFYQTPSFIIWMLCCGAIFFPLAIAWERWCPENVLWIIATSGEQFAALRTKSIRDVRAVARALEQALAERG